MIAVLYDNYIWWVSDSQNSMEKGLSFGEILDRYVASVKRTDAESISVVFDRYSAGPSAIKRLCI